MNEIILDREVIQSIMEKLYELQEIELLEFTDFSEDRADEDIMLNGKGYVECNNLINYLKTKL